MKVSDKPTIVKASDYAGVGFGLGQFRMIGGRALYDEVWIEDGGNAFYLARLNNNLSQVKRWIPWETKLELFEADGTHEEHRRIRGEETPEERRRRIYGE